MKTVQREFSPGDRYLYDFKVLTPAKGWAQIDTQQDASYFGQWINPTERKVFTYCEGDCTLITVDTDYELQCEMLDIYEFNRRYDPNTISRFGIDPLCNDDLKQACINAGLEGYLH